jgi:hypothetical protein
VHWAGEDGLGGEGFVGSGNDGVAKSKLGGDAEAKRPALDVPKRSGPGVGGGVRARRPSGGLGSGRHLWEVAVFENKLERGAGDGRLSDGLALWENLGIICEKRLDWVWVVVLSV